jgi:hypothetical protein
LLPTLYLDRQLLARVGNGEILAFTSTQVLSEVAHHLMTLEIATIFGWSSRILERLKQQPTAIQRMTSFRQAIEHIPQLSITILTIPPGLVATAAAVSQTACGDQGYGGCDCSIRSTTAASRQKADNS